MDYTEYIVQDKEEWYVSKEDINTGKTIAEPGTIIIFKQGRKIYTGFVTEEPYGRDKDVYRLSGVRQVVI